MKKTLATLIIFIITVTNFTTIAYANNSTTHVITDTSTLIGNNAPIWEEVESGDIIDISMLETTELGRISVPETISALTIKGASNKTYTKFNLNCTKPITITVENVKASSSTGASSFNLPSNAVSTIVAMGVNSFTAAQNSKCIIGNVIISGSGDLTINSGTSISNTNLAHGILGDVIFDNSGTVKITSGKGQSGTSSSYAGISAGDAICGNVECRNVGEIYIQAGNGGNAYNDTAAVTSKSGNGGSAVNGNLICTGSNNITLKGGSGGYIALRNSGNGASHGNAGAGCLGNVIIKNNTTISISGGEKRTFTNNVDGQGIYGYLKVYDEATVTVNGGNGSSTVSYNGAVGGIGVQGNVYLYNNSTLNCNGGNGSVGDSGNKSYPTSFGNGGDGSYSVLGDVYLYDYSSLNMNGGNGGNGGSKYSSSSSTTGSSTGGKGATAIFGNLYINDNSSATIKGGNGGTGGNAGKSYGGSAGSGMIGDLSADGNIKLIVTAGNIGTKYYSVTSGGSGSKGYGIITSEKPLLNGGHINALFYNNDYEGIAPINASNEPLYLVKITPNLNGSVLSQQPCEIIANETSYITTTNENGEIFCYLPSTSSSCLKYGEYIATLSQIWEDNNTSMFVTLSKDTTTEEIPIRLTVRENIVNGNIVLFVKSNIQITTEMLHIALYSSEGQLLDYIIVPTIEPFTYTNVVFDDNENVKTAKVFLWNGRSSITPLTETTEITLR